jgi:hypothetical protein
MSTMESIPAPDHRHGREFGWRFLISGMLLATGAAGVSATVQARSQFPMAPAAVAPTTATPVTPSAGP